MTPRLKRFLVPLVVLWAWPPVAICSVLIDLEAGQTRFGSLTFERLKVNQSADSTVLLEGIAHATAGSLGDVIMRCRPEVKRRCIDGSLTWNPDARSPVEMTFQRWPGQLRISHGDTTGFGFRWSEGRSDAMTTAVTDVAKFVVTVRDMPLEWLPTSLMDATGLAALSGRFGGDIRWSGDHLGAEVGIDELAFDTPDGRFAGGGLIIGAKLDWWLPGDRFDLRANWRSGELLLGPLYLPSPESPIALKINGAARDATQLRVDRLELEQAEVLALTADGLIEMDGSSGDDPEETAGGSPNNSSGAGVEIRTLNVELEQAGLAQMWRQGLNSVAAAYGWGQLEPSGTLSGRLRVVDNAVAGADLRLTNAEVDDSADRVFLTGLNARVDWARAGEALEVGIDWRDARLFRIPLGPAALALRSTEEGVLELAEAFRLPVLDGAFSVQRLEWQAWTDPDRTLAVDARLEPVDLSELTRTFGWPEFGGSLSGNFPGVEFADGVLAVKGGLDIDLFGGSARINGLAVERPFGSLPALAADIEFEMLKLEQVTSAFEFGRMLGLLSGHVRDLRLLDWQPVRFDAWFETLEESPQREISQRAVNSISSLSGGGGAAISGTLLRWFDDFPYRRFGLGCRLAENVCRMRGLEDAANGGYMILEGRLIPRLDIVGYQRRVDWPRLIAQLAAATESVE